MTKPFLTTTLLLGVCLFILSGCGKQDSSAVPPPLVIDNETVVASSPAQQAHAFCVSQGFSFVIERSEQQGPELFCRFLDGSRCPAVDFLNETCEPDSALAMKEPTTTAALGDVFQFPRFCEPVAEPVCGVNGRTYSNECIANQQGVAIQYEGTCDPRIEPTNPPTVYDPDPNKKVTTQETQSANSGGGTASSPSNPGNTSAGGNAITYQAEQPRTPQVVNQEPIYVDDGIPDWLAVPFSLVDGNQSVTKAWIEACPINGGTYYLQVENCETCFSTLYTEDGSLICNPSNDISGTCPSGFANGKPASCRVILEK